MTPITITYGLYLLIGIGLTIWVGRTLNRYGRELLAVFPEEPALGPSIAHLLVVGFYLVNFGFLCFILEIEQQVVTAAHSMEALSVQLGMVLLFLGSMHLLTLYVVSRVRRWARLATTPPPVTPDGRLSKAAGSGAEPWYEREGGPGCPS